MEEKSREYQRCISCVLDSTDPDIKFDDVGVCNYCRNYLKTIARLRLQFTPSLLESHIAQIKLDGKLKKYDVIVGVSGGVDSSYVLYLAVKKFGLRVLALHVDSGWDSEIAVGNIHKAIEKLGVDLYTEVIDWDEMRDIQAAFFRASVVNCDIPQDHAFRAVQYKMAKKLGSRYFISGRNFATDSMMPQAWVWPNHDSYHIKAIHKQFGRRKLNRFPFFSIPYFFIWLRFVERYQDVTMLNYFEYKREQAKAAVEAELGWRDYGGKHYESVFTEFYQSYYLPVKFGFDKRKAHLSGLIMNGELSRANALKELEQKPFDTERIQELERYVIKKLGFTQEEWHEIMTAQPKSHDSYPNLEWITKTLKKTKQVMVNLPFISGRKHEGA